MKAVGQKGLSLATKLEDIVKYPDLSERAQYIKLIRSHGEKLPRLRGFPVEGHILCAVSSIWNVPLPQWCKRDHVCKTERGWRMYGIIQYYDSTNQLV